MTMTTGFPTRASAACGTASSRYSSACSCKPPLSSTVTKSTSSTPQCTPTPANNILKNGGFECGLGPWVATDNSGSKHSIVGPGDASNFAYQYNPGPVSEDTFSTPAEVKQPLTFPQTGNYVLTFRSFFDQCAALENYIGVYLGNEQLYQIDACSHGGVAGRYFDNTVPLTSAYGTGSTPSLRFEFIAVQVPATARIDNVILMRV